MRRRSAGHVHDSGWDVMSLFISLRELIRKSVSADRCLRRALCPPGSVGQCNDECAIGSRGHASGHEHGSGRMQIAVERLASNVGARRHRRAR